jgi:branched-chain amino acid transport system ATP-binding protein
MLLSAQNVSKAFGSFLAVRGADLAVAEGEIIGLIGPNGAGKCRRRAACCSTAST